MKSSLIDKRFKVLNDGFVCLKDFMGSDIDIEQAARVSYQKGTRAVSDTRNLLRYCMRNRHTSIFEQAVCKFYVRAPILVFRQWHRHRTFSYNEMSGRYSVLPKEFLLTEPDEWRLQSTSNKQGSEGILESNIDISREEQDFLEKTYQIYENRLELGVSREQARKDMPVSVYSEMYFTVNLHNLLHFMSLRCDSHAQLEIRQYANVIAGIVKELYPLTFEAWADYHFCSANFTRLDLLVLTHPSVLPEYVFGNYHTVDGHNTINKICSEIGMSKREITEFWEKLKPQEVPDFSLEKAELYEA